MLWRKPLLSMVTSVRRKWGIDVTSTFAQDCSVIMVRTPLCVGKWVYVANTVPKTSLVCGCVIG